MEKKVNFAQYQQVKTSDLQNMQDFAERSVDNIVSDTLVSDMRYAGLLAAKSGPAVVSVAPGRLYVRGAVYAIAAATTFDFTARLPVAGKKNVLITAWGSEADTNVAAVNFLNVTQSTPQAPVYTPQEVATEHDRICNLGTAIGAESPSPSDPIIGATLLPIARVVISPTGVDSVTMLTANEVSNLEDVEGRVDDLETWEALAAPQLASLASDIARLSNDIANGGDKALTGRMLARLAVLEAKDGIPSNAADSSADFFLDPATSDLANLASDCLVAEGVRFADAAANDSALQLFNPLNPDATIRNGVLFPAYDPALRLSVGPRTGELQISAYTYQTTTYTQKTMTRTRTRWGTPFIVCTNSAFWQSGQYDPTTGIFKLPDGEVYSVDPASRPWVNFHAFIRLTEFWNDSWTIPYWDIITTDTTISGSSVEETFPVGQDDWLERIALQFTKLDASGPVTLLFGECISTGELDETKILAQVTVPYASLTTQGKTPFVFPTPVFRQSGRRYGYKVVTAANHFLATADGPAFPNAMLFEMVGGVAVPNPTKHLVADFYTCKFRKTVAQIDLQGLQLAGGIVGIDILAESIAPSSTSLTYAVQLSGVWIPIDAANAGRINAGGALPPLLPFRAVFQGTPDMMPCVNLLKSNVHVNRPKTSYTHFWPAGGRTLPAPSSQIRVTERYEGYDGPYHSASAKLLTGAGYATETSPSSYSDVTNADGSIERTFVWNFGAAVSAYKLKSQGTTSTALKTFHIAWLKDWAL